MVSNKIQQLKNMIEKRNNIVFFGGAGVSTESGIPDFRSSNGLYNQQDIEFKKYDPEYLLSEECLYENPGVFYKFYKQKLDCRNYEPNITHYKLAELERKNKLMGIITQNIDGLHQKAGNKKVCELHGNNNEAYCSRCKKRYNIDHIFKIDGVSYCSCGGLIRPNIVLYGEYLKDENWSEAVYLISNADLLIIAGTSLTVHPAKSLISYAHCPIVIINKEKVDVEADLIINDLCGNVFKELIE